MYEYKLTKRNGKIVSRKVFTYRWTIEATKKRAKYHETKNGKTYLRLPIKIADKPSKLERLESRPFSEYHNKLIDSLYSQKSKSMQILRKIAENDKHEIDIENMSYKLKAYKSSLKLRNTKNMLYTVETYYKDNEQQIKTLTCNHVSKIPDTNELANLNRELSQYPNYHHLTVKTKDKTVKNDVMLVMVNCAA